jgi:hypothetical protein
MSDPRDPRDLPDPTPDDDPTAARLRAALTAEAAMVQPDDSLSSIRERTGTERPWWQKPAVLATAAAVVLGLAAGGAAAVLGGDDDPTVAPPGGKGTATGPATTSDAEQSPSPSEATGTPTAPPVEGNLYVYYVMAQDNGLRLYREERPNPGMDPVTAALSTMFTQPALDPDYDSPWPGGTGVVSYSVDGETATLDLSDFPQVGAAAEDIAVQQVVYTVTANDTSVKRVQLLVDGKTPPSGHQDWSEPVSRAPRMDVQGLIWLLGPTEGATVSSPVEITGYGTAFEATVNWEVRRQDSDEVVAEGFPDAGANGEFADFSDSVELDPGTYELRAFESSAEDGRPLNTDTKVFTVE